jgi:probable phosphoglycerate mutase
MQLILIRHGESYVNLSDWTGGNMDEGLTDLGQRQADALASWIVTEISPVDCLYASTMQRARETAQRVADAYEVSINWDNRLREIGNNRHDHTPWPSQELPDYGGVWGPERPFSSITPAVEFGESWMHFRTRVGSFIEEMAGEHKSETVMVVCHGGVIGAAFDHIFNIGPWRRCEVWSHNTGVTRFEYVEIPNREVWRLRYQNRHEHLKGIRREG